MSIKAYRVQHENISWLSWSAGKPLVLKLPSDKYNDTFLCILIHGHPQVIGEQKIDHKPMTCHAKDNTIVNKLQLLQ